MDKLSIEERALKAAETAVKAVAKMPPELIDTYVVIFAAIYQNAWADCEEHHRTTRRPEVEGVDYTPEGIMKLREEIIAIRNRRLADLGSGENAMETIVLTHAIAILSIFGDVT